MSASASVDKKYLLKWVFVIAVACCFFLIPVTETFTAEMRMFLMTSCLCILIIACDLLDMFIASLALPTSWVILGVTKQATAFGSFTNQTLWVILAAYALTVTLDECGLLRRISYIVIKKIGGTYNRTLYAIYIVGVILGFLCFCGHYFVMIGFVFGICQAMNLKPKSKEGAIMMGVGGMAALNVKVFLYQTSNMNLLMNGMSQTYPDFSITMVQLFLYNFPEFFVAMAFIFIVTKIYHTKDVQFEGGKEYFERMHREMGAMTVKEKKAAVLLALLMVYIMFQPVHKFPLNYGWLVLPWLAWFPGIRIASNECLGKVRMFFGTFVFAGACIGIGNVATNLGLGDMLAQAMTPVFQSMGKLGTTYTVLIFGAAANLILTPAAMCTLLPTILGPIYQLLGYDPITACLTVIYSLDIIFLPHEVTAYLVLFGFGMMNMRQFLMFFGGKSIWTLLCFGVIQIPWWSLMGVY